MKKHKIVKVVLAALLVCLLLSWILPAAYYSGEYIDQGRMQMGLSELFNYPITALSYFGHISLFIIFVGCFYGVLYKIPAYRKYLDWIVAKFEGKEIIFISIVVLLLSCGVSIAGLNVAFALFIPMIVSIILLMGYDKMVAALTVAGGIGAGLIGTTYAYNNMSLLLQILSLDSDYQIVVRFIILAASVILLLFNILVYMKRHEKGVVVLNSSVDEKVATKVVADDVSKSDDEEDEDDEEVESDDDDNDEEDEDDDTEDEIVEEKKVEKSSSSKKSSKSTGSKSSKSSSKSGSKKNSKSGGTKKNSSSKKSTSKAGTNKSTRSKNPNKAALKKEDIIVVKESVVNSNDDSYLIPDRVDITHKVWPLTIGFLLLFVLVVLAFITWGDKGFGITLFDDVTEKVTNFELFGFPVFSKIYGSVNSFGNWTIIDLMLPTTLLTMLLVIIYNVKLDDVLDGIAEGAKRALAPAFVVIVLYTILVLTTYHPFQLAIYKAILGLTKGYNIFTTLLTGLLSSIFNIEPAYTYQGLVPYYVSIVTNSKNYANAGIVFQTMYGYASLIGPTSLSLMCILSYLNVSYKEWLKTSWKLLIELLAILVIVFLILTF